MRIPALAFIISVICSPLIAQETTFTETLCERDAEACRALAVEIVRLDLVAEMERRADPQSRGSFICADGGNCCPEGSEESCARLEANLLAEGHYLVAAARQDDCNLVASLCDTIETTCERDEIWLPWSGCTPRIVIEDPRPPLPPSCPPGSAWNGKVCKPEPCYTRILGIRIPCPAFEQLLAEQITNSTFVGPAERSANRLLEFVQDERVRDVAVRNLRADLQRAIDALDRIAEER